MATTMSIITDPNAQPLDTTSFKKNLTPLSPVVQEVAPSPTFSSNSLTEFVSMRRGSDQSVSSLPSLPSYEQAVPNAADLSFPEKQMFSLTVAKRDMTTAADLVAEEDFAGAEEIYIELWLDLTEQCRNLDSVSLHEQKIQLMLTYARFMQSRGRTTEASALLLCIWREYEFHAFAAVESIVIKLKDVAVLMKQVDLLSIALSVFKKCWTFFKSTRKTQSSVYRELEQHITATSKEVAEVCSRATLNSTSSESDVREMFDWSMSSSSNDVSATSIELCKALAAIYIKEERYTEAIVCIRSVVKKSWSSFFSVPFGNCTFQGPSVELVMQLAFCYRKQSRIEKAEKIYMQLYRSVRSTYGVKHDLTNKYSHALLQFYQAEDLVVKAITLQQELLVEYRTVYGKSHDITIKTLYALGDLCRQHPRTHGYWIEYFVEVINNLSKSHTCHPAAMRALVTVAENYLEERRFAESVAYYEVIAATFFDNGVAGFKDVSQVQTLFEHYQRALEACQTDVSVQIGMLQEYHEACTDHYGEDATITLAAALLYASACAKSEDYQREAISLYETVSRASSGEVTKRCNTILRGLYMKQASSSTVTKKLMDSATALVMARYQEVKETYPCTHEITINALSDLVSLYKKQSRHGLAVKELRQYAVRCLAEINTSREFMTVGASTARMFMDNGYMDRAQVLVRELKMQVIFNLTSIDRVSYAFLAAFECELADNAISASELMVEYAAASLYFERYSKAVENQAGVEAAAAKLRGVLGKREANTMIVEDLLE